MDVVPVDSGVAKFDLQLTLAERRDDMGSAAGFAASFTYASDIFDRDTVAGFGEQFVRILSAVVADSNTPVGDVDVVDSRERDVVVGVWNETDRPIPSVTLADLFDGQVLRTPNAPAVVFDGTVLSYREFGERVNRLARFLISVGVGPESRVGVAISRSVELLVAVYAVLEAGGAYVAIDPGQPPDRVGFVVGAADPVVVLTTSGEGWYCPPVCSSSSWIMLM